MDVSSKYTSIFILGATALLLSSCATLDKKECLTGDWVAVGKTDGSRGQVSTAQLAKHTKACGKHGVQLNTDQYMSGHGEGLKTYCTTESGFNVGSEFGKNTFSRSEYKGVCPSDLELGYLEGYIKGMKLNLDMLHGEVKTEEADLADQRSAFLILKALNSSKADGMEEDMEEDESSIDDKKSTITETIKEIEKWLLVHPELRELVN